MRGRALHDAPAVPPGEPAGPGKRPTVAAAGAARPRAVGRMGPHEAVVDLAAAEEIRRRVGDRLKQALADDPQMDPATREQRGRGWINDELAVWYQQQAVRRGAPPSAAEEAALAKTVFDLLFRAGRLQPLLEDDRIETIFINGCDQVWADVGDGRLEPRPPVADSDAELLELLRHLARTSGEGQTERTLSHARPFLALRLPDGSRLQAITSVSARPYVTIRRHRHQRADLDTMVRLGAIDTTLRAFLSAAVKAGKNIMVAGPQAAGKTTLLRALLREYDRDERFAVVETEGELIDPTDDYFRQALTLEARESNGERGPDGRPAGEITLLDLLYPALRMSLSRVVVGEVRGPEVVAMMQALTSGQGGNLCTIHALSPYVVFDRIAELYAGAGVLSEDLAYRQIANGLDFVVYVQLVDERPIGGARHRFVSHVLEVTGRGEDGRPATNTIFAPRPEAGEVRAVPHMHPSCLPDLLRAGLPPHALDQPYGAWGERLPLLVQGVG